MMETKDYFQAHQVRMRVAALIEKDDAILLIFDPVYRGGCWILPGGGAEFAETAGQAVEREVLEETGLKVCARALCGLREIWEPEKDFPEIQPVRKSIELLFSCTYLTGEINIRKNPSHKPGGIPRVADCRWIPRAALAERLEGHPVYPAGLIEAYLTGQLQPISLATIMLPPLDLRP